VSATGRAIRAGDPGAPDDWDRHWDAFGEAAWGGKTRDENLARAFEGTALLIELMNAFEIRRDLRKQDDPELRAKVLEAVLKQLDCDKEQPLETPQVPRVSCKRDDPETA